MFLHYLVALWELVGVFRRGAFSLRNKIPVFLQIFLITETQREERKSLPGRRRKQVFPNTCFSAWCSLQRPQRAGTSPWVLRRKDEVKVYGAPVPDPGQVLLPRAATSAPPEPENEILYMGKGPQSLYAIPATHFFTFPNCLFAEVIIE